MNDMLKILRSLTLSVVLCLGLASCRNPVAPDVPKVSIFCDYVEAIARQEGITFAEAAKRLKDLGYTGVDVWTTQKPWIIKTLDSLGFEHSCLLASIDYPKGDQKEAEDRTLAFMEEHGYDRVMLVAGFMPDDGFSQEDRELVRQRIASFAERVVRSGHEIMVEDFGTRLSVTHGSGRLDSLFAITGDLGMVFDTGNFMYSGEDVLEMLDRYRDKIGHVHLKDLVSPSDWTCVAIGTGCIPVREIIGKLVSTGYNGWYTVELSGSKKMLSDSGESVRNITEALTCRNTSRRKGWHPCSIR